MRPDASATSFEIHCLRCRVSFPVGTRSCIHCGERLGRQAARRAVPMDLRGPEPEPEDLAEEELQARSGVMSPVAILWIGLLLAGAIYRACG